MDQNILRSILTVLGLVCFLGIAFWAYNRGARAGFEEAAKLPFTEDELPAPKSDQHPDQKS